MEVGAFETYVESIFLYNCGIWTATATLLEKADALQRSLLERYVLNVKWTDIKNYQVYSSANMKKLNSKVATHRIQKNDED